MEDKIYQETMDRETETIEEVLDDTELEVRDDEVTVIDLTDCTELDSSKDVKETLKKLGIVGAVAAVLVLVWKKFGKKRFMELLARILRKAGWDVKEPNTEVNTSTEEACNDVEEFIEGCDESDDCDEVED